MKAAKALFKQAMHACGVVDIARFANRRALRILMYHRFADRKALEKQCRQIIRSYTPVSMQAVARQFTDGTPLPWNALAVTIDDGYPCYEQIGNPVFSQFGIPITVYLATDFIDRVSWFWDDWSGIRSGAPAGAAYRSRDRTALSSRSRSTPLNHAHTQHWRSSRQPNCCRKIGAGVGSQPFWSAYR